MATDWLRSLPSYVVARRSHLDHFQKSTVVPVYGSVGNNPTVFSATQSVSTNEYGCWESHMAALLMAERDHPLSPSLHFEDDAVCTVQGWWNTTTRCAVLEEVKQIVEGVDPLWRIIGLGGCPLAYSLGTGPLPPSMHHVLRTGFVETHAYIISPRFRKHILDNTAYEGRVDYLYAREAGSHAYLVAPELFAQQNSSDNKYIAKLRASYKQLQFGIARHLSRTTGPPWRVLSLFLILGLWCMVVIDLCFHASAIIGHVETLCILVVTLLLVAFEVANAWTLDPHAHTSQSTASAISQICCRERALPPPTESFIVHPVVEAQWGLFLVPFGPPPFGSNVRTCM